MDLTRLQDVASEELAAIKKRCGEIGIDPITLIGFMLAGDVEMNLRAMCQIADTSARVQCTAELADKYCAMPTVDIDRSTLLMPDAESDLGGMNVHQCMTLHDALKAIEYYGLRHASLPDLIACFDDVLIYAALDFGTDCESEDDLVYLVIPMRENTADLYVWNCSDYDTPVVTKLPGLDTTTFTVPAGASFLLRS